MNHPLVSVIIPCFRQGHFLSKAVESALAQTYQQIQVVVVNDGSDDNTEAIAAGFRGRIRYVSKKNGGLCSARNAGVNAADGRYLLFLDADDLLDSRAVGWLVECMHGRDDRLALMGFRFFEGDPSEETSTDLLPSAGAKWFAETFDIDPLLVKRPNREIHGLTLLPYLIYTNFGPPHCWLSSRRMVREVGAFDETLSGCGDWDLWLRLALARAELVTTDNAGAFYRRYAGSMSSDNAHMLDDRAKVFLKASPVLRGESQVMGPWTPHLLQAARRIRRRYVALGIDSTQIEKLTREIRLLQGPHSSGRFVARLSERLLGPRWDRVALTYYRYARRDLFSYYQSDTD